MIPDPHLCLLELDQVAGGRCSGPSPVPPNWAGGRVMPLSELLEISPRGLLGDADPGVFVLSVVVGSMAAWRSGHVAVWFPAVTVVAILGSWIADRQGNALPAIGTAALQAEPLSCLSSALPIPRRPALERWYPRQRTLRNLHAETGLCDALGQPRSTVREFWKRTLGPARELSLGCAVSRPGRDRQRHPPRRAPRRACRCDHVQSRRRHRRGLPE